MTEWITEPLASPFMRNALAAGLLGALTCALVGTWVVLRGQTFLGEAIAHGVLPGVGFALELGVGAGLGALAGALAMAGVTCALGRRPGLRDDVAIGVTLVGMLALGVIVVSRSARTGGELTGLLFGSIAGVTGTDLAVQAILTVLTALAIVALHRPLTASTLDPDKAEVLGLHPARAHLAHLGLVAVAVVVSFQAVGALLVFALMTAPPAAAALLTRRIPAMMAVAAALGSIAVGLGLVVSWHSDTAIGATIAAAAAGLFTSVVAGRAALRRVGRRRGQRAVSVTAAVLGGVVVVTGCAPTGGRADAAGAVRVATTSELLADLVGNVAGPGARVRAIIPSGADPHSYEPPPSAARLVASADLVVSNGLLLETQAMRDLIEANLQPGAVHLVAAEAARRTGARARDLEEKIDLEVPWLGVRVDTAPGTSAPAELEFRLRSVQGPGAFSAYVTDSLGAPRIYLRSDDGIGAADRLRLPAGAHTHLNWAFDAPGVWSIGLAALHVTRDGRRRVLAEETFRFAVDAPVGGRVVERGHVDVAFRAADDGAPDRLLLAHDELGSLAGDEVTLMVPAAARDEVPDDPRYRFLGPPGRTIWVLPQAVAGIHTHGRLDPHLWLDPRHAGHYVRLITDRLRRVDPDGAAGYRRRADAYLDRLDRLDRRVRAVLRDVPVSRRRIVSTHDAFGYFARAYGFAVAGFVAPTPGQEPSVAAVARLERAIRDLPVRVVFAEPTYRRRADLLRRVADRNGASVCTLYGETFDARVRTYEALMLHNARELRRCLGAGRDATPPSSPTRGGAR